MGTANLNRRCGSQNTMYYKPKSRMWEAGYNVLQTSGEDVGVKI